MDYKTKDWKIIIIKDFVTRKISREYTTKLLWDNKVWSTWKFEVSIKDTEIANDYLIKEMTWLNQDDLDELENEDFKNIFIQVNKIMTPPTQP